MEYDQGMTRTSVKGCIFSLLRRWWLILIVAAVGFLVANIIGWRSYKNEYQVTFSFVPAGYSTTPGASDSQESFTNYVARSISYTAMVKNRQMSNAVIKAVDFPLTADAYDSAVAASSAENSAVVNITLTWDDEDEIGNMQQVIKSYLSYLISNQTGLGGIRWIDGYAQPSLPDKPGRYVLAAVYGVAGGIAGLFMGVFAALTLGLLDSRVFELEYMKYGRDMEPVHIVPRDFFLRRLLKRNSREYRLNCEVLAEKLVTAYRKEQVRTVVLAPIGSNREVSAVRRLTVGYLAAFGIGTEVIQVTEAMIDGGTAPLLQRIQSVVRTARKNQAMVVIQCPDLATYRGLSYIINEMDLTLFLFRYGKSRFRDLLYAAEQYQNLPRAGCIWTGVSRRYLKQPLREFASLAE